MAHQLDVIDEIEDINNDLNKYVMLKGDLNTAEFKMLEVCKKALMDLKNKKVPMFEKERALHEAMRYVLHDLMQNYKAKNRMDAKRVPEVGPLIDTYDKLLDIHLKLQETNKLLRRQQKAQPSRSFTFSKKREQKQIPEIAGDSHSVKR